MLWGAGRLLLRAAGRAAHRIFRRVDFAFLTNARERLGGSARLVSRVAIASVFVGLVFGGVRPSLDRSAREEWPSPVGDAGAVAYDLWGGSLGSFPGQSATGLTPADRDGVAPPSPAKRTALIIGINHARGGRTLPGSITDAKNMRDALLAYGFKRSRITLLIEEEASAAAIRRELDSLARRTPRDGLAVFAVATHTRRRAGRNELLTADGGRISSTELALRLAHVRSRMWVALPTCYAGGYALPGIVGPRRIATFASPRDQQTYQLGNAGSYLFIHMVRRAMLEGRAPASVESAFRYALKTLKREAPNRVPIMSDGIRGELVLGRFAREGFVPPSTSGSSGTTTVEPRVDVTDSGSPNAPEPPEPTPAPQRRLRPGVCGPLSYNCSTD